MNLLIDAALIFLATFGASLQQGVQLYPESARALFWCAAALVSVWIVSAMAVRHYSSSAYCHRTRFDDAAMISIHTAAVITMLVLLDLLAPAGAALPRILWVLVLLWAPSVLLRIFVFRRIAAGEEPQTEVLVVGTGPVGRLTVEDLVRGRGCRVIGHAAFADENGKEAALLERSYARNGLACRRLGTVSQLAEILRTHSADEVYIAGNARRHADEMQEAVRVCEKFGIPFALPAYAFRFERAQAVNTEAIQDGYLHFQTTGARPSQLALKRLFDVVASAAALWLFMPLLLVVMVLIKLTSRGPVFFKQVRVGLHGRPFNMLKFRSMVANAEQLKASLLRANEQTGPVFKMKMDPRVTRIGRFIRKYSIDELPQLINVLRGDMSIVGPRPPVPSEVDKYEAWQRRRLSVRPGLTCIWQVSGRNQISFEEWMYLDMQYIDHWSLGRDFNLIFRTVPVVMTGRGAS